MIFNDLVCILSISLIELGLDDATARLNLVGRSVEYRGTCTDEQIKLQNGVNFVLFSKMLLNDADPVRNEVSCKSVANDNRNGSIVERQVKRTTSYSYFIFYNKSSL